MQGLDLILKQIFIVNYSQIANLCQKEQIKQFSQAAEFLQQRHSNMITTEEQELMDLFVEVDKYIRNETKSLDILIKLTEMGVDTREQLHEMDDEDLKECSLSQKILSQRFLPFEFEKYFRSVFSKHKNIEETIERLIERGIYNQDQLFQITDDEASNFYKMPKYTFRTWKSNYRPSTASTSSVSEQTGNSVILKQIVNPQLTKFDNQQSSSPNLSTPRSNDQSTVSNIPHFIDFDKTIVLPIIQGQQVSQGNIGQQQTHYPQVHPYPYYPNGSGYIPNIQPQMDPKQLKEELQNHLSHLIATTKFICKKNGLDVHQYPIYKKSEIADLQEYKTVIMIGQTGSGKSTLINYFLNYYLGIEFENSFRFFLIDESNLNINKSQAISQTQDVMIYYVKPINGNPGLRIIDTPGFGDTRGIEQDQVIAKKIQECFKTQVNTLTTICFLVQSSNARLTINQSYILSSILQMFGNDVIENFVFMFTFCDGQPPQAQDALLYRGKDSNSSSPVADLIQKIRQPWFLKFNSSAFLVDNKGDDTQMVSYFWKMGMNSFKKFVEEKIKKNKDVSLQLTRDVIKQRETIMNVICHLRPKIQQQLLLIEQHKQTYQQLNLIKTEMFDTQNYTIPTKKYIIKQIDLEPGEYVTNCVTCNQTCHYPCGIPDNEQKKNCSAMKNGNCTVCKNKCKWDLHKNMKFRFETDQVTEQTELTELKLKYLQSQSSKSSKEQVLDGIVKDYEDVTTECMLMQQQLMDAVNTLNEIALQPAVCKHQEEYVEIMIKEEENKQENGWMERVKSLKTMKDDWVTLRLTTEDEDNKLITTKQSLEQIVKKKSQQMFGNLK